MKRTRGFTLQMSCFVSATVILAVFGGCATLDTEDSALNKSIQKLRTGTIEIRTKPGARVAVHQVSHEFWFGTAVSHLFFLDAVPRDVKEKYVTVLKENFNAAVPENVMKWAFTEPQRGQVSYAAADAMVNWCEQNGIRMRGHCVYWDVPMFVQDWVEQLDDESLNQALESRAKDLLTHFKGHISEYDVNNEMLHGSYYADRLGPDIRTRMFLWCKQADPDAVLYVNDFGILWRDELDRYDRQIEELLASGSPVGGIGIQGHLLGVVDRQKITRVLDRLARFGLPIKITEFDVKTLDEQTKAQALRDLYTTCFAHRAVNGILMWGFWAGSHWLGTKEYGIPGYTALWDKEWRPTPAGKVYQDLVYHKWWTHWQGKADRSGVCRVRAFFGRHKVTANGVETVVDLTKAEGSKTITVR